MSVGVFTILLNELKFNLQVEENSTPDLNQYQAQLPQIEDSDTNGSLIPNNPKEYKTIAQVPGTKTLPSLSRNSHF